MSGRTLSSATPISTSNSLFWDKLQSASSDGKIGFFKTDLPNGSPLYVVSMDHSIRMVPFVRTAEELFEQTVKRKSATENFKVVINGPTYGLTKSGYADAVLGWDPVPAKDTLQQGQIILNNKVIGGRKSNMYYIRNDKAGTAKYTFGKGVAPINSDSALGNMGPLIINKLAFGSVNVYKPPQPRAKKTGEPTDENSKFLTQRSNKRFAAVMSQSDMTGKVALGYKQDKNQLIIMIQPNGSSSVSYAGLRSIASKIGLDSAVYLDGSDSVMLMLDNNLLISQGSNKNETNITGVGFAY